MLFGISTTIDSVLAPSKVSAASSGGKNPPGAESVSGEITALNWKKSKKNGSCLGPANKDTPSEVVSTMAVAPEISTSPKAASVFTSLLNPVCEGATGPKKYILPSLAIA